MTKLKLFDAHCHLQLKQFDTDRDEVLARMRDSGVGGIVVGTDFETSKSAISLAQQHDFLWASVGLHPNDNKDEQFDISNYEQLAHSPKVVAVGECGLDYYRSGGTDEEKAEQKVRFEKHIELAVHVHMPIIVHCRNAHEDCLNILKQYKNSLGGKSSVIIHFFTGSTELAQQYLELGCYLSFPGPTTYTDMYDGSIQVTPPDRTLIETDAPFAAPVPYRGKRNEPAYVKEVAAKIASLRGHTSEDVSAQIVLNSQRVFGLQ